MSVFAEPAEVGPADYKPTSDKVVTITSTGSKLVRQDFADGSLYQLQVLRGASFDGRSLFEKIPAGKLMGVIDPEDVGDLNDPYLYISVWVQNN